MNGVGFENDCDCPFGMWYFFLLGTFGKVWELEILFLWFPCFLPSVPFIISRLSVFSFLLFFSFVVTVMRRRGFVVMVCGDQRGKRGTNKVKEKTGNEKRIVASAPFLILACS